MGKAIVLILIALGANVHAEDMVVDMLVDRASNNIVGEIFVDMDDATLAKPAKASGAAPRPVPSTGQYKQPNLFTSAARQKKPQGKLFGGANNRNSNNPNIMAKLKGKATGMYGETKGTWYTGGGNANEDGATTMWNTEGQGQVGLNLPLAARGKFTPIASQRKPQGKLFGGANNRHSTSPSIMAKMKGPGAEMYGKPMSYQDPKTAIYKR